jgi:hypothetical protein
MTTFLGWSNNWYISSMGLMQMAAKLHNKNSNPKSLFMVGNILPLRAEKKEI